MPILDSIRFVDLNYDNNKAHIPDMTLDVNKDGSLWLIRNGGGKSVMAQMITQPYVFYKHDRDFGKREFKSYLLDKTPLYMIHQYKLDDDAGYLVICFMAVNDKKERKNNQNVYNSSDEPDLIDNINIVTAVGKFNFKVNISSIPFFYNLNGESYIKSFRKVVDMFSSQSSSYKVYNINNSEKRKEYIKEIASYKIDINEWKEIIKTANSDESGLSRFFENYNNAADIVRRVFLPKIQVKLENENFKLPAYADSIYKYFEKRENNEENITNQQVFSEFIRKSEPLLKDIEELVNANDDKDKSLYNIKAFGTYIEKYEKFTDETIKKAEEDYNAAEDIEKDLLHEMYSLSYYNSSDKLNELLVEQDVITNEIAELENLISSIEYNESCLLCAEKNTDISSAKIQLAEKNAQKSILLDGEDVNFIKSYEYTLKNKFQEIITELKNKIEDYKTLLLEMEQQEEDFKNKEKKLKNELIGLNEDKAVKENNISNFETSVNKFSMQFDDFTPEKIMDDYIHYTKESFECYANKLDNDENELLNHKKDLENQQFELARKKEYANNEMSRLNEELLSVSKNLDAATNNYTKFLDDIANVKEILKSYDIEESELYNKKYILSKLKTSETKLECAREEHMKKKIELSNEVDNLKKGEAFKLPVKFKEMLDDKGVYYNTGFEWLKDNPNLSKESRDKLLDNNKLLPYCLIIKDNIYEIENIDAFVPYPIPLLEEMDIFNNELYDHSNNNVKFYSKFNYALLEPENLKRKICELETIISGLTSKIKNTTENIKRINTHQNDMLEFSYNVLSEEKLIDAKESFQKEFNRIIDMSEEIKAEISEISSLENENIHKQIEITKEIERKKNKIEKFNILHVGLKNYLFDLSKRYNLLKAIDETNKKLRELDSKIKRLEENHEKLMEEKKKFEEDLSKSKEKYMSVKNAEVAEKVNEDWDIEVLYSTWQGLNSTYSGELESLNEEIRTLAERIEDLNTKLGSLMETHNIQFEHIKDLQYTQKSYDELIKKKNDTKKQLKPKRNAEKGLVAEITTAKNEVKSIKEEKLLNRAPKPRNEVLVNKDYLEELRQCGVLKESINKEIDLKKSEKDICTREKAVIFNMQELEKIIVNDIDINFVFMADEFEKKRIELIQAHNLAKVKAAKEEKNLYESKIPSFIELFMGRNKAIEMLVHQFPDRSITPIMLLDLLSERREAINILLNDINISLSSLEDEKNLILDHLFEYIKRLYIELGEIDKGSIINIEGEGKKKVLKIKPRIDIAHLTKELIRIQILDEIINGAKIAKEDGKNVLDFINNFMKANKLFDRTYGINSIDIKLYKITERGLSLQTFEEAKTNSGGEGSFTAFTILSCIMSYYRKNDLNTNESWKFMILDNPFAKLTSRHLLKPLFDLAKKLQVQLLCLSDIDTEGVKDMFDDIRVFLHVPVDGNEKETILTDVSQEETAKKLENHPFTYGTETEQISLI